eukprot:1157721-Pelagomonas_calceolata.AAC.2
MEKFKSNRSRVHNGHNLSDSQPDGLRTCHSPDSHAQEVAKICNITAMPTFQVWKNKACVDTLVGANLDKLVGLLHASHANLQSFRAQPSLMGSSEHHAGAASL